MSENVAINHNYIAKG